MSNLATHEWLSEKARKLVRRNPDRLSPDEVKYLEAEFNALTAEFSAKHAAYKKANPFWYYQPVTGDVSPQAKEFLSEFLNPKDIPQKLFGAIDVHLSDAPIRGASGGNQCIAGETLIYNPLSKRHVRVDCINGPSYVLALDESTNKLVPQYIRPPFIKGIAALYEVSISNGASIRCTEEHKFLTEEGWKPLSQIPVGHKIVSADCETGSVSFSHITSVCFLRKDQFWDLTVGKYHNYFAQGFINHNSSKTTIGCIEAFIKSTGSVPFCFDASKKRLFQWEYPKKRLERNGPQFVRVIGEDYQNGVLRNLVPTYRKWAPKEFLLNGSFDDSYSAGEQTLRLFNPETKELTGIIEFMSNKQELGTFAGPPRHFLVLDEEPAQDVYKENLMRFTTASSLDVLFCMTPDDGMSWTFDLSSRGQDNSGNKIDWFQIASVCNPHANLQVLKEIVSELTYEERKMRLLGEFVSLSGLVYGSAFQPSLHVVEPFETGCTCGFQVHMPDCPYQQYQGYLGIDPHMVKASCAALSFIDREGNFYVDTCYKRTVDTDEFKKDLRKLVDKKRMSWAVFDPSSDSTTNIYSAYGARANNIFKLMTTGDNRVEKSFKGDKYAGSIAAGVSTIKQRLNIHPITGRPRFFIMNRPENQELIRSMRTLQRDVWANEDIKGQKDKIQEGVHDHHACVRYILQNRLVWTAWNQSFPSMNYSDEEAMVA